MQRLIDANSLEPDTEWDERYDRFLSYSQSQIDAAPTIEPEVRRGRWVYTKWINSEHTNEYMPAFVFECSECLSEISVKNCDSPLPKYCSECGAFMIPDSSKD